MAGVQQTPPREHSATEFQHSATEFKRHTGKLIMKNGALDGDMEMPTDAFEKKKASKRSAEVRHPLSLLWMAPPIFGFLTAWLTILVANSPLLHNGSAALNTGKLKSPDPHNCDMGTCWDQADKYGYPLCSGWTPSGLTGGTIRGHKLQRFEAICYRSIMINMELNAFCALGVLLLWGIFTSSLFGSLARAVLKWDVRVAAAVPIVGTLPAWYYCGKATFVYINEYMYDYLPSQTFYTISESVMLGIMKLHLHKSSPPRMALLAFMATTSVFHVLQMLMDENEFLFSIFGREVVKEKSRNIILILGDIVMAMSSITIMREVPEGMKLVRAWFPRLVGLLIAELVLFQLFLAGYSSKSFSFIRLISHH